MKADYLVKNAAVFTADAKNPAAEAFAVKDGRFLYVESKEGLKDYEGEVCIWSESAAELHPES